MSCHTCGCPDDDAYFHKTLAQDDKHEQLAMLVQTCIDEGIRVGRTPNQIADEIASEILAKELTSKPASAGEFANLLRAFGRAVEPNPDKPFSSLDMMVAWDAVLAAYEAERRRAEAAERREEELRDMNDRLQASLVLHNDPKTVTLDGDYFHEMEADRDRLAAIVERVKMLIVDGCQVDVNGGYYFDSRYAVKLDLALDPEEDK